MPPAGKTIAANSVVPPGDRYKGDLKHLRHRDCWVDPYANIAVVGSWEHDHWADETFGVDSEVMLKLGWLKKSGVFFIRYRLTQVQLDLLCDMHRAFELPFDADCFPVTE